MERMAMALRRMGRRLSHITNESSEAAKTSIRPASSLATLGRTRVREGGRVDSRGVGESGGVAEPRRKTDHFLMYIDATVVWKSVQFSDTKKTERERCTRERGRECTAR